MKRKLVICSKLFLCHSSIDQLPPASSVRNEILHLQGTPVSISFASDNMEATSQYIFSSRTTESPHMNHRVFLLPLLCSTLRLVCGLVSDWQVMLFKFLHWFGEIKRFDVWRWTPWRSSPIFIENSDRFIFGFFHLPPDQGFGSTGKCDTDLWTSNGLFRDKMPRLILLRRSDQSCYKAFSKVTSVLPAPS